MSDVTTTPLTRPGRGRFLRARRERLVTGVAGGIGARLGVDPIVVRIAFVILTLAGGAGVLLYALGWLVSDEPPPDVAEPVRPFDLQQTVAVSLVALGTMVGLRSVGVWISDGLVLPAVFLGVASAVIWTRGDVRAGTGRASDSAVTGLRIAVGVLFALGGLAVLLAQTVNPLPVLAPLLGLAIGAVLLFAPLLQRLLEQLGAERHDRARAEAREEVAAHLHDSVLQTLVLIQRANEPRRMASLARRQERELRHWLYGGEAFADRRIAAAVAAVVDDVETEWHLDVDVVVVGDLQVDAHVEALLGAVHEALRNAGRHSGTPNVSLYVEVTDDDVEAWVRDRGTGFDPAAVPEDRRGLRDSVVRRLARHGGAATVTSAPGDGTEVHLRLPRTPDEES